MIPKKLLIPRKVFSCMECPNTWLFNMKIDGKEKSYYLCGMKENCRSEDGMIPDECPLPDWKE